MIVVSDTSPITSLMRIGQIELLRVLFHTVKIPATVARELRRAHPSLPDFISAGDVSDSKRVESLMPRLDRGEAEAIVLAQELKADFLLIDETLGRTVAIGEGLKIIGVVGVLIMAKRNGLLPTIKESLERLEVDAGFYLDKTLKQRVLADAGEI